LQPLSAVLRPFLEAGSTASAVVAIININQQLTKTGTILIAAQTLGGALAGGMLRGSLGYDRAVSYVLSMTYP